MPDLWTHHGSKFVIGTLHGEKIEITAQYNPKELARQATASWTAHPNTAARHSKLGENHLWMEYGTTEPRTLTIELVFDGYEEGKPIGEQVENLERLTLPVDMSSRVVSKRRPQLCVAVWGNQSMRCVVTSVATKLTMFGSDGQPLRATCTVVLKEVDVIAMMKADGDKSDVDVNQRGYVSDSRTSRQMPYPPEDSKPTRVPPPNRSQDVPASAATPAPAAPKPASAASPPPVTAPVEPAPAPGGERDETPEEVAADEKRVREENDADAARYQHGTPSQPFDPATMDSSPDETPEEVAADEKRVREENDADAARYQHGTPSQAFDGSDFDSPPQSPAPSAKTEQPAPDAVSGADRGTADPKYKAAAEDME